MTLPRIGLIESACTLISVFVLAALVSSNLFLNILLYVLSVLFMSVSLTESARWFLKHESVKRRDFANFSNSMIVSVLFGILSIVLLDSLLSFLLLTVLLGATILVNYDLRNFFKPFLIAAGILVVQLVFFGLIWFLGKIFLNM